MDNDIDRFAKALLGVLFSIVFLMSLMIDWQPWSFIGMAVAIVVVLAVRCAKFGWDVGREYLADLKRANEELKAKTEAVERQLAELKFRLEIQNQLRLEALRYRCEAQHLALFEGNFRYWLYGECPPAPGFDVFEDWPTAPSAPASASPQSSSAPASPAAT